MRAKKVINLHSEIVILIEEMLINDLRNLTYLHSKIVILIDFSGIEVVLFEIIYILR